MANAAKITSPSYRVFESGEEALQAYPHLSVEQEHIPSGVVNGSKGEAGPAVSIASSDAMLNNNIASVTPRVEIEESPTNIIYSSEASTAGVLAENKNIHLEHINNSSPVAEIGRIVSPEVDLYSNLIIFRYDLFQYIESPKSFYKVGVEGEHELNNFICFAKENNILIENIDKFGHGLYEIKY